MIVDKDELKSLLWLRWKEGRRVTPHRPIVVMCLFKKPRPGGFAASTKQPKTIVLSSVTNAQ